MPTVNIRNRTPITSGGPLKLNTEDRINEVDPRDTPFLRMLGWNEDAPSNAASLGADSLKFPAFEKQHTWNNDVLVPNESLVAGAYTSGGLAITVTTNEGPFFKEDDIVTVVDDADTLTTYRVASVSGDVLTVVLLSGSDADADVDDVIIRQGNARVDGDVFDTLGRQTTISQTHNFTQIFQKTTGVTGTENAIEQFGIAKGTSFDRELGKAVEEVVLDFERVVVMGLRTASVLTTNVQPAFRMGGAFYYLRDSTGGSGAIATDNSGNTIDEVALNTMLQSIWAVGGKPDTIVTTYTQSRNMTTFFRPFLQADFDQTRGGVVIGEFVSNNGPLNIMISRWLPHDGDLMVMDFEQLGFGPMGGRQLEITMLPQDGDYVRASILGEYTMEFMNNTTHHGWLFNNGTTAVA